MSITATELKMNLGKYLSLSETEDIYITRNGKVVAKLTNPFQDRVDAAFVRAWNLVVSKKLQYGAALRRRAENAENALIHYRAKEMLRLLDEVGKLRHLTTIFH